MEAIQTLVFDYGYSIEIEGNRSKEKGCHLVNQTWGGEGTSAPWTEERKKIKSKQCMGRTHSNETLEKIRKACKQRKARGGYEYISIANKDRESKPIAMINIETGEAEEIFMSIADAVEYFGLPRTHISGLSDYLRYIQRHNHNSQPITTISWHGYEWVYLDEYCDLANVFNLY